MHTLRKYLSTIVFVFIIFAVSNIALYYSSLSYYWVWDDLHVVRTFSRYEILRSFYGTWDPDNVETPGLRPFTVIFNHVRCTLLGETLWLHKLFLILLFSVCLSMICYIGNRYYSLPFRILIAASILLIAYKYTSSYILMQIHGTRIFQLLLSLSSLLFILRSCNDGRISGTVCAVVFYSISLLTREDSAAAVPILLILPYAYMVRRNKINYIVRAYAMYALLILIVTVVFFLLRKIFIPQAILLQSMFGSRGGIKNIFEAMAWAACPFGKLRIGSVDVHVYWLIAVGIISLVSLCILDRKYRITFMIVLICYVLACTPAYMILKPDILLLPMVFFCLFLSIMLMGYASISRPMAIISFSFYVLVSVLAAITNYAHQQSFHPLSLEQISREYDFLYGEYSHTTVPLVRRYYLKDKFESLGIAKDGFDCESLAKKAHKARLLKPKDEKEIFVPRFRSWEL